MNAENATVHIKRKQVGNRSFLKRLGYDIFQWSCRLSFTFLFGVRCFGRKHFPETGGALVCSNHQSHLDPMLLGILPNRRMNYLARRTLYEYKWLVPFIDFLDAIPLDREGLGIAGIKETLRRLKRGEMVAMFPEGTRTRDGELAPFLGGFVTIARRARVPLVPVGLDGAFQAWPKGTSMFRTGRISIFCEQTIWPSDYENMTDDELLAMLRERIEKCFERARRHRRRQLS
jgi:1-acyl-sn-glycerol-3-phosphate acyltransferase